MADQASDRIKLPRHPLTRGHIKHKLIHELARDEKTQRVLAREYGVAQSAISQFKTRYATEIAEVRADLENEFAGLWIAQKMRRLAEYQADAEEIGDARVQAIVGQDAEGEPIAVEKVDTALVRAKHAALRAVAEEMGQIPAKVNITVEPVTVRYEVVGVDPEDLK